MNIEVTHEALVGLKIRIDGLVHVFIADPNNIGSLRALHAWMQDECHYFIEFYLSHDSFVTEYDHRWKWEAVLQGLENPTFKELAPNDHPQTVI